MSGNRNRKPKKITQTSRKRQREVSQQDLEVENVHSNPSPKRRRKAEQDVQKIIKKVPKDKTAKKKSKKKVVEEIVSAENNEQQEEVEELNTVEKNDEEIEFEKNNDVNDNNIKEENVEQSIEQIPWSSEELMELLTRMENSLPEHDTLAYSTRAEKLDWNKMAFNNYTGDDCKKIWMLLQKKIRKFRLLNEVLNDAKKWVLDPKSKVTTLQKTKRHPDMPKRPPSSYLLFCSDKRDEIVRENPGVESSAILKILGQTFRNLTPDEREAYEEAAARSRANYHKNLNDFYEQHPEFAEQTKKVKIDKPKDEKSVNAEKGKTRVRIGKKIDKEKKELPPKRCQTPFGLYYQSELANKSVDDKQAFKERCKELWKELPDKKKLPWILKADEDFLKYKEEIRIYNEKYPDRPVQALKSVLTKSEVEIKKRSTGEPKKPPNSPYNLYSKAMLQSEEIKSINAKDRLLHIANMWRTLDEDVKQSYRDQYNESVEKYKSDLNSYIETLPEEQRALLIKPNKKTKKINKPVKEPEVQQQNRTVIKEPVQPPISPYKYFASIYEGNEDPLVVWKSLSSEEKHKYDKKLIEIKEDYLVEFENFLKSLSQDELETFCKSRPSSRSAESSECTTDPECEYEDDSFDVADAIIEGGDYDEDSFSCDSM